MSLLIVLYIVLSLTYVLLEYLLRIQVLRFSSARERTLFNLTQCILFSRCSLLEEASRPCKSSSCVCREGFSSHGSR